jgi:hypothetical protein
MKPISHLTRVAEFFSGHDARLKQKGGCFQPPFGILKQQPSWKKSA